MFFLTNLLLAVLYNNYRVQIENTAKNSVSERSSVLSDCFLILDETHRGYLDYEVIYRLLDAIQDEVDKSGSSENEILRMLDTDRNGIISQNEFGELVCILKGTTKKQSRMHHFHRWFPSLFEEGACCFNLRKILNNLYFECLMNIVNITNVFYLLIDEFFPNNNDILWGIVQLSYLVIYLSEMVLLIIAFGMKRYLTKMGNLYEALLTLSACAIFLYTLDLQFHVILKYIILLRLFRILKLLVELDHYRMIFKTFIKLIPTFGILLGVMFTLFYSFSILGVALFGGKIYHTSPYIINDINIPKFYVYNNFNDFPTGMITLFELLVVNNISIIVEMHINVTTKLHRVFFVSFYVLAVMIAMNLMVAFVLEIFNSQWEIYKQNSRKLRKALLPKTLAFTGDPSSQL